METIPFNYTDSNPATKIIFAKDINTGSHESRRQGESIPSTHGRGRMGGGKSDRHRAESVQRDCHLNRRQPRKDLLGRSAILPTCSYVGGRGLCMR